MFIQSEIAKTLRNRIKKTRKTYQGGLKMNDFICDKDELVDALWEAVKYILKED